MHLVRTVLMIKAGHAADFEHRQRRMAEAARGASGYMGATLLHSFSHPARYAVLRRFEDVEAAWAFEKSDVFVREMKNEPADSVVTLQHEGFDAVVEVEAEPAPRISCEVLVDEMLKGPEVIPAFESTLAELFALRKKHVKGYGANRLHRSGGRLWRYLVIQSYADLACATDANVGPEVQAFIRARPASLYTDVAVLPEAYHVLFRV